MVTTPIIGRVQRDGYVITTVPECWVLFDQNNVAIGWMRGDTHLDVFTPEAAHRLFARGKQLRHEQIIGFRCEPYSHEAGLALVREAELASKVVY